MSLAATHLTFATSARATHPKTRVWRPFPREVADIVGVEDYGGDLPLRMHPWFAITLVRSAAVVTVESRREVVAHRNSVVLVPPFHLYGLRSLGAPGEGALTLLLKGPDLEGRAFPSQAALTTDPALCEQVAALMSRLLSPVALVEHATTTLSVLGQLLECSAPLAADRARGTGSLARVRTYLTTNVNEMVVTGDIARMSGLSEGQAIRSFHYLFGLPPHAYHLRVRLAAACELLTRGVAIARVAHECGFADQSHLSRRFKSVYAVSPATWALGADVGRRFDASVSTHAMDARAMRPAVSLQRTGRGR